MKKVLGGCLVVLVIAAIGFAVAGFYAYRWARPMIDSAGDYVARAREMSRLTDEITNKTPFEPPKSGELTAAQVDRFVAVQSRVRRELGERWKDVEARAAEIRDKTQDATRELSVAELTSMVSDLAGLYLEARREQVKALNIHKFSDAEYSWVRLRVYEAAGMHVAGGLDMSKLEEMAREGAGRSKITLPDIPRPDVPKANIALVKPHASQLKEWVAMAVIGL